MAISGLFVFAIGSFYLWELRGVLSSAFLRIRPRFDSLLETLSERKVSHGSAYMPKIGPGTLIVMIVAAVAAGYFLTALLSGYGAGGTIIFVAVIVGLIVAVALRTIASPDCGAPVALFVSLLAGTAFALVIGLDVFRVEGDIERMNSVFKFYLQVWVLLALAAAFLLWRLLVSSMFKGKKPWEFRYIWAGGLAILLMSASIYPVLGAQDRLRDRFNGNAMSLTLDGLEYIKGTTYNEAEGRLTSMPTSRVSCGCGGT